MTTNSTPAHSTSTHPTPAPTPGSASAQVVPTKSEATKKAEAEDQAKAKETTALTEDFRKARKKANKAAKAHANGRPQDMDEEPPTSPVNGMPQGFTSASSEQSAPAGPASIQPHPHLDKDEDDKDDKKKDAKDAKDARDAAKK